MTAAAPNTPERRATLSWVVYDLANTIFALGVVGFYFSDWLVSAGRPTPDTDLAIVQMTAAVVVVFLAPWAGARSDALGKRVPTLAGTTLVAVAATAFLGVGPVELTMALLAVALVAVNTGSVVYDALLVDVSTPETRAWVSGLGVGVGYFGSFIGLGIGLLTLDVLGWGYPATFRTIAVAFLVFAIPSFIFVTERPGRADEPVPSLTSVARRIVDSWALARRRGVARFLVGRFFYTDAINTIISGFLAIFVIDELGLDRGFFTALMGVAISAAVFGGLVSGRFVTRLGPLKVLRAVLILWVVAIGFGIVAAITGLTTLAWGIGPLGGLALGATWASDRVVMTRISPPKHLGELYGLYATVGRFATIFGPLVWAVIVDRLNLGRSVALGALGLLIVVGWWVLRGVDDTERVWPVSDQLTLDTA